MTTSSDVPSREDLADLIERLRIAEFRVGASEAIDATALLMELGRRKLTLDDPARLRSRLRPVFCKSAEQQRQFDVIFDEWWSVAIQHAPRPPLPPPPAPPLRVKGEEPTAAAPKWIAAALLILVLAAIAGYSIWSRRPAEVGPTAPGQQGPLVQQPGNDQGTKPPPPPPLYAGLVVDRFVPSVRYNIEIRPWWVWALVALPIAALLTVSLPILVLGKTRLRRRAEPMFLDPGPLAVEARRLVPRMHADISDRLARHVRSRGINIERWARRPSLDIRRTIEATLRNYGIPTLRFSVARVHPSYLVLIDAANETDPRGRLFYQWAERLQREGLDIELMLMRQVGPEGAVDSLRVCNAPDAHRGKGQWIPLRRMREPLFGERLIVISDGSPLVDSSGKWASDARRARFYRWRDRAVFTPAEPRDWGVREESLERAERVTDPGFIVLPLEESALAAWTDLVLTGQLSIVRLTDPQRFPALLRKGGRRSFVGDEPPPPETIERLIQQLRLYLGDRGFYWLAAIAATPIVRWELVLLIGKAALSRLPRLADEDSLNASLSRNYPRLVRLPWLQRQSMPNWLRLRLLVELSHAQQTDLREVVGALLGKLPPFGTEDGIKLELERPPAPGGLVPGRSRPAIDEASEGDPIYLGYMSGLSPDQLVLRAPREWASWASRIPLRREPGLRGMLARLRDRTRAEWARWVWAGGLPHLGMNRGRLAALGLLMLPLAIALGMARSFVPDKPTGNLFFAERAQQRVIPSRDISSLALSADGRRLAIGHSDGTVQLWDARTSRRIGPALRAHTKEVRSVEFDGGGDRLTSASLDGTVRLWNVNTAASVGDSLSIGPVLNVVISDLGNIVHAARAGKLETWNVVSRSIVGSVQPADSGDFLTLASSTYGEYAAAGTSNGNLRVWNDRGALIAAVQASSAAVRAIAFSPDLHRVVFGGDDRILRLWDLKAKSMIARMAGHEEAITHLAFSPDGARIVSASTDRTVRLWDARTGAATASPLRGHTAGVLGLALSEDSQHLASSSVDGTVRLWDTQPGEILATAPEATDVRAVAFSPDRHRLATAEGVVKLRDARTLAVIGAFGQPSERVTDVAFSPDGRRLAAASDDGTIRLWDVNAGTAVGAAVKAHSGISHIAFSPDGSLLASGSGADTVRFWDTRSLTAVGSSLDQRGALTALAFGAGGRRLAVGGAGLQIWDVPSRTRIVELASDDGTVLTVGFSRDGTRLVAGTANGATYVWDLTTATPTARQLTPGGDSWSTVFAAFSDGRLLRASSDGRVRLWDAATLEPIGSSLQSGLTLPMLAEAAAQSPDGAYAAFAGVPLRMVLWRLYDDGVDTPRGVAPIQRAITATVGAMKTWTPAYWLGGVIVIFCMIDGIWNAERVQRLIAASKTQS